jgi:16S rRNA C967 or C1407 C5-methylase (RsmB/RsmF family)
MISIGDDKGQLLVKVAPVTIATDPDKFKKQMSKAGMRKEKIKAVLKFDNYEFDKFWNERYLFFERFDEGIKIKEDSWSRMPYESLAEYISTKCKGAKVILDGYAGVGSLTIKLASINTCAKVIANEKDKEKLSFLLNNATIYEVDSFLELSNMDFLQLEKKKVDVVILQPPMDEIQN